jgi:hypothetical protein
LPKLEAAEEEIFGRIPLTFWLRMEPANPQPDRLERCLSSFNFGMARKPRKQLLAACGRAGNASNAASRVAPGDILFPINGLWDSRVPAAARRPLPAIAGAAAKFAGLGRLQLRAKHRHL